MITKNQVFRIKMKLVLLSIFIVLPIGMFLHFNLNKFINFERNISNHIYPNVYIDNELVGGKSINEIEDSFNKRSSNFNTKIISIMYKNTPIATFSGKELNIHFDSKGIAERAYLIGRSKHFFSSIYQKITSILGLKKYTITNIIQYDKTPIHEFITYSEDKYNKPAKNALFKFENGKVINFRQEEKGNEIQSNQILENIDNTIQNLKNKPENIKITLMDKNINPEITLAKSNTYGIEEIISEGVSNYSHSIPERIYNVLLAASKFNGILIPKNKIFSFNESIGDISSFTGYKPAYIIKEGKTVLGDGGGVCQVSTTLFRAALNAGLEIIERLPHAYRVSYYENDSKPGFDATVFSPYADLKIKNNTSTFILIQTEIDKEQNILTFKLYGKKDNRRIELSPVMVYDVQPPPPPRYQDDATLKKGVLKQIDFPAWGAKANFTYNVYLENQQIINKNFFSSYKPWQAVYLQGIAD